MNQGVAPEKRNRQLRGERLFRHQATAILQTQIADELPGTLVKQAKEYSESEVVRNAPANQRGRTILPAKARLIFTCGPVRCRCRDTLILLVMKPDQPVILKIVKD